VPLPFVFGRFRDRFWILILWAFIAIDEENADKFRNLAKQRVLCDEEVEMAEKQTDPLSNFKHPLTF
jgi:hypothetical protein